MSGETPADGPADSSNGSEANSRLIPRRQVLSATAASVLTAGLAGCPGDESDESPASDSPPTETSTPATAATATGTATPTEAATDGSSETATDEPGSDAEDMDFEQKFESFVTVEGTEFVVDGETHHPTGGNHPQLRKQPFADQTDWFEQWTGLTEGVDVLRATAFGTGRENTTMALQPSPGKHDETAFRALDRLVALAGHYGVRLILPLANYWPWQGGLPNYQEWVGYENKSDFYTSTEAQEYYRNHISTVLNRENQYTGVRYRDDPAIMMWELMNEPRLGSATVEEFTGWVRASAEHIKDIDPNHLVSTGLGGGPVSTVPSHYEQANGLDAVDAWSIHPWADSKHQDSGISGGVAWIRDHTEAAHSLDMPIYVGEFGWPVVRDDNEYDPGEIERRYEVLEAWLIAMRHYEIDGALVWDLRHNDEYPLNWNDYGVFPRDPGTEGLLSGQYESFASPVSSGSRQVEPPSLSVSVSESADRKRYVVPQTDSTVPDDPAFSLEPTDEYLIKGDSDDLNEGDLSGDVYLGYDADNLYLTVEVTDDTHMATGGGSMWQRDAIQWAATADGAYGPEYGFAHVDGEAAVHRWLAGTATAGPDAVDLTTAREGSQTTYESTVPWTAVFSSAPSPGDTFPFGITINDNDNGADQPSHILGWTDEAIWDEKSADVLGLLTLAGGSGGAWRAELLGGPGAVEHGLRGQWEFELTNVSESERTFEVTVLGSDVSETIAVGKQSTARVTLSQAFETRGLKEVGLEIREADTDDSTTVTATTVAVSVR